MCTGSIIPSLPLPISVSTMKIIFSDQILGFARRKENVRLGYKH